MDERRWKVGELARATGLTVRALHHFDQIGLLRPGFRSNAGHRLYTDRDVRRLRRIIALRQLGVPLADIASSLDGAVGDLERTVREQCEHVQQLIGAQQDVHRRLAALDRAIRQAQEPSVDELITTMEAIVHESYFTPDQLAHARQRHAEPGFADRFVRWREQCAGLVEEIHVEIRRGTGPADPAAQALARRWSQVLDELAGGNRDVVAAIYAKIDGKGPEAATRGTLTAEAWNYLRQAFAVGFGRNA